MFFIVFAVFERDLKRIGLLFVLMVLALTLADATSNTLKHLIKRPRPFLVLEDVRLLVGMGRSYAMPSGHATNTTAVATVLWLFLYYRGRVSSVVRNLLKVYLVVLVVAVGLSRVYVGVHWPGDVLVGTLLGTATGTCLYLGVERIKVWLRQGSYEKVLYVFLGVVTLLRLYYIGTGPLDLSPDEAQYWDWSRHPQLSYYSKPPVIAYLIRLSTVVFGDNVFGVRFFAPLLLGLSGLVVFDFTRRVAEGLGISEERACLSGLLAGALLQILPLFATYGVIMTIDSPLIFFWSLGLWLFLGVIEKGGIWRWMALGVVVGLGMLTKFTMVMFVLSAFLFLVLDRQERKTLLGPYPWLALAVVAVLYLPVVVWNWQNHWVYFRHVAGHGDLQKAQVIDFRAFVEFIGSQLGVLGIVVFFLLFWAFYVLRRPRHGRVMFWFSIPTLGLFLAKSIHGKVQANWPLVGYISGASAIGVCVVMRWEAFSRKMKAFVVSGFVLAFMITLVAHYPQLLKLPPRLDPSARLRGWETLARKVDQLRQGLGPGHFVFSDRYQITAELAFYLRDHPRTYCVNLGRRMTQYDLWEGFYDLTGHDGIFLQRGDGPLPEEIISAFRDCQRRTFKIKEGGHLLRTYTIGVCRQFRGMKPRPFTGF